MDENNSICRKQFPIMHPAQCHTVHRLPTSLTTLCWSLTAAAMFLTQGSTAMSEEHWPQFRGADATGESRLEPKANQPHREARSMASD